MPLALNTIKSVKGSKKSRKRIGRGNASGRGTYSTRGQKGQKARAGVSGLKRIGFRDTLRRIPKTRGFKSRYPAYLVLNVGEISKIFKNGEKVNLSTLRRKGIIGKIDKKRGIKILGNGDIDKKLIFEGLAVTKNAEEKIKKAGGKIVPPKK